MSNPWQLPLPDSDQEPEQNPQSPVPWWYWVGMVVALVAGGAVVWAAVYGDIGYTSARAKLVAAGGVTTIVAGLVHAAYEWTKRRRR